MLEARRVLPSVAVPSVDRICSSIRRQGKQRTDSMMSALLAGELKARFPEDAGAKSRPVIEIAGFHSGQLFK